MTLLFSKLIWRHKMSHLTSLRGAWHLWRHSCMVNKSDVIKITFETSQPRRQSIQWGINCLIVKLRCSMSLQTYRTIHFWKEEEISFLIMLTDHIKKKVRAITRSSKTIQIFMKIQSKCYFFFFFSFHFVGWYQIKKSECGEYKAMTTSWPSCRRNYRRRSCKREVIARNNTGKMTKIERKIPIFFLWTFFLG